MSWVLVFLGFSLLIILHEAGHFVAAKATGMKVERFFLFFGPTIWSFKRGETEYGIKSIPLGGYVKISGMNPEEKLSPEVEPRSYLRQPVWKRIVVVGAGPAVNIALALVILFFVALTSTLSSTQTVQKVLPHTPASHLLKPGDRILAVDGSRYLKLKPSKRVDRFREEIGQHRCPGKQTNGCLASTPVRLTVERDGQVRQIAVRPKYRAAEGQTLIGFAFGSESVAISPGEALDHATGFAWEVTHKTATVFSKLFESQERKQVSGVVGISDVAHETINHSAVDSLILLAVVSLSLGLINLLPVLPLDGGHIFWSLVEKLRGRPAPLRVIEVATAVGIVLVAALVLLGLTNDIGRLTGEGFNVR